MKLMIASDIHGSAYYCKQLLEAYRKEGAEKLILLGDVLYHGPRNDLPRDYAPKEVIAMLNAIKEELLCVRGNCDTEVDQMVLEFPVLADYAILFEKGRMIYATHGHVYNEGKLPPLQKGDILLLAGKGGEETQEIMGIKYPFNDNDIIEKIITEKRGNGLSQ